MHQSTCQEEQRYAREEILVNAEAMLAGDPHAVECAMFAAAVREYLTGERELEHMTPSDDRKARLVLADAIEREFAKCQHTMASSEWCPECGAAKSSVGLWLRPNWLRVILRALLPGALLLVALTGCGGSSLDVGSARGADDAASVLDVAERRSDHVPIPESVAHPEAGDVDTSTPTSDADASAPDAVGHVDAELEAASTAVDATDDDHWVQDSAVHDVEASAVQQCTALPPDQGATTYVCDRRSPHPFMCGHTCCTLPECP